MQTDYATHRRRYARYAAAAARRRIAQQHNAAMGRPVAVTTRDWGRLTTTSGHEPQEEM